MADKKKKTSRKTLRKDEAPYARKLDDAPDSGDDKGDKGKSGGKSDDKNADAKSNGEPAKDAAAKADAPKPAAEAKPEEAAKPTAEAKPEEAAKPAAPAPAPAPAAEPAAPTDEPVYAELPPAKDIDLNASPDAPAPAPGIAPPGDSRSFRRAGASGEEFVLIYRQHNHLITRSGPVGKFGKWSVIDYPNQGSAASAYAHKCSEYTADGYYDLN